MSGQALNKAPQSMPCSGADAGWVSLPVFQLFDHCSVLCLQQMPDCKHHTSMRRSFKQQKSWCHVRGRKAPTWAWPLLDVGTHNSCCCDYNHQITVGKGFRRCHQQGSNPCADRNSPSGSLARQFALAAMHLSIKRLACAQL